MFDTWQVFSEADALLLVVSMVVQCLSDFLFQIGTR
jgi:hypothetical protein